MLIYLLTGRREKGKGEGEGKKVSLAYVFNIYILSLNMEKLLLPFSYQLINISIHIYSLFTLLIQQLAPALANGCIHLDNRWTL
jgi:hypothetical protein